MVIAPLLAAPAVMFAATAAERRYGAAVAGLVGAAPVALAVVIVSVGDGAVAASAAAHVIAQVAFAVAFALVVVRRGGLAGVAAGSVAYAAVSAVIECVPPALAIVAAIPSLLVAARRLPEYATSGRGAGARAAASGRGADPRGAGGPSLATTALGAAASIALVGSSLTAAHFAGPEAAGAIGAFPAVSTAFALVLVRSRGTRTAANALKGLTVGLRGYLAFCLVVAATGPAGVALGLVVCAAQSFLPRKSVLPGGFGSDEKVSALPSPLPRADSCTNRSEPAVLDPHQSRNALSSPATVSASDGPASRITCGRAPWSGGSGSGPSSAARTARA
jgi:hypothetical protein